jgi:hypothetical protein
MEKGSREETKYAKKGGLFFFLFFIFPILRGKETRSEGSKDVM